MRDEVRNEVREAAHEVEVFKERTVKETQKLIRTARKHAVGAFQDAREVSRGPYAVTERTSHG